MKKILVINANPKTTSLCKALAEHYVELAQARHDLKFVNVGELDFQMNLDEGYDKILPLENDLITFQENIKWAEHVVIVTPVWWGTMPAKFKALIDRTYLPGFAFKYTKGMPMPQQLLKGRTFELIITMDTPPLWYKCVYGNPIYKNLNHTIMGFVGMKNISTLYLGPVLSSSASKRQSWFDKVARSVRKIK